MIEAVNDDGTVMITQKNKFCTGDEIEVMKPDGSNIPVKVTGIHDEEGNAMDCAPHSKQKLYVKLDPDCADAFDILRVKHL